MESCYNSQRKRRKEHKPSVSENYEIISLKVKFSSNRVIPYVYSDILKFIRNKVGLTVRYSDVRR